MMTTQDPSMPPAGAGGGEGAASDAATTANLNAGFAKVRGADTPDATGAQAGPGGAGGGAPGAASAPAAPGAVPGRAAASPVSTLGTQVPELSTEQMRDLLAKVPDMERAHAATAAQLRQAFGKIGALQQTLQALQPKAADSQGTRRIKAEALKRLSAQYGPELADALSHDLSEALGNLPPPQASQGDGGEVVDRQGLNADQRMEARLLTRDHPDWKVLPGTTDFRLWLAGLPAAVQREFQDTWDADYLSRVFSSYKAQRAAAQQRRGQHTARLDRAVPAPSGGAARQAVMPDAAGLQAGFNRVRGAR